MGMNILIAGAAGYIGGSLLADLVADNNPIFKSAKICVIVRTEKQATALSKLGVLVIVADLSDEVAVLEVILRHEIDVVVNAASSFNGGIVSGLLKALGQRRKISGKKAYFIHSSVTAVFSPEGGWPEMSQVSDNGDIFEQEKNLGYPHPVHDINILVVEVARKHGVTAFNVVVPIVYGRGSGEGKLVSAFIPTIIRSAITHKAVYKFDRDGTPPATHITDLTLLYSLLLQNILLGNAIASGEKGYYFAGAHTTSTWETMERIAKILNNHGLIPDSRVDVWPSDEMAAEYLQYPLTFVRTMGGTYSVDFVTANMDALGWQPKWDKERMLQDLEDEVSVVQEMDDIQDPRFYDLQSSIKE